MKKFTIVLLSTIFVTLISSSVPSVVADHLEPGIGIFLDENSLNFTKTIDTNSKYEIYVQTEVRSVENQLISISETDRGNYIPHEISDFTFYEMLGETKIVTHDNIQYEKIQYTESPDLHTKESAKPRFAESESEYIGKWSIRMCGEFEGHGHKCVPVFETNTAPVHVIKTDVITIQWTILRVID